MADTTKLHKIDFKDTKVYICDADGTPSSGNRIEIEFGDGDFQWTETEGFEYNLDRGVLSTVDKGDEVPMDVSFEGKFNYVEGTSGSPSLRDALKNGSLVSAWVSASAADDPCGPWSVNIYLEHEPACAGSVTTPNELLLFSFFRAESVQFSVNNGTISVSGKCNATAPESTRS